MDHFTKYTSIYATRDDTGSSKNSIADLLICDEGHNIGTADTPYLGVKVIIRTTDDQLIIAAIDVEAMKKQMIAVEKLEAKLEKEQKKKSHK